MYRNGELYEYIFEYVDDLAFTMKDPDQPIDTLETRYGFKTKEASPLRIFLGNYSYRNNEGVGCMVTQRYIEKLNQSYESPMKKSEHPELHTSKFIDKSEIEQYQFLLGTMQWTISPGHPDILEDVILMFSICDVPRKGHLQYPQCI